MGDHRAPIGEVKRNRVGGGAGENASRADSPWRWSVGRREKRLPRARGLRRRVSRWDSR